jgi:predicted O-methyltransferase YrrM
VPETAGLAINPLDHPIIFATPRRLPTVSAWREHVPFAMFLVELLRPESIVELGTHSGTSYCAFCQAVDELGLTTRCYGVDTWEGDPHSGSYGPEVLADLKAHHDPLYGTFSRLIQSSFDDALEHFPDRTIDLLHLDGYHTYEASRHDFDAWLPKMSERGVVLIHDINTRERDFGVWRLWEEIRDSHPHLELLHAHGLGILAVGDAQPQEFRDLLSIDADRLTILRELFFQLGYRLRLQLQLQRARERTGEEQRKLSRKLKKARGDIEVLESRLTEAEGELESFRSSTLARVARELHRFKPVRGGGEAQS